MAVDRQWATVAKRTRPTRVVPFDGTPRFALICVNFSTTHYLKLMLLTLSEQDDLTPLHDVIVVDNGSRDGGQEFLRLLDASIPHVHVVFRRHRLHHAVGMRSGVRRLDRLNEHSSLPANVLLFCDADVIFRDRLALRALSDSMASGAALAGEWRRNARRTGPNIQASFFAVRRDVYARRDVAPLMHDGAPAARQQASLQEAGLVAVDFPSNHGGFILHRGRTGVEAASVHRPSHAYASVLRNTPHFMHVAGGAGIWNAMEEQHAARLEMGQESALLELLAKRFRHLAGR